MIALLLLLVPSADVAADLNLADYYGFAPLEVYEADNRHFRLTPGDFGGDARTDLAVIDNGGSQIKLWIQSDDAEPKASDSTVNGYLLPGRFTDEKVLVDREVLALAAGDTNGDGTAELITIESGDIVQVRRRNGERWTDLPPLRLADLGQDGFDLTAGDFNGDGSDDLVALGIETTYLLLADANEDDGFADPIEIPNTSDDLDFAQLVDLDGDDKLDLFYAAFTEEGYTACFRLQQRGRLGAERRMEESDLRALTVANCDEWPGAELIAIDDSTGRVKIQKLKRLQTEGGRRLSQLGLGGKSRDDRGWVVGDFDGDGSPKVVVSDPEAAELLLLSGGRSGLEPALRFPSLQGITQIIAQPIGKVDTRDMLSRGQSDLLVLSKTEETVGVVRIEQTTKATTLGLPQPLAMEGQPVAIAVNPAGVAVVLTDGKSRGNDYSLVRVSLPNSEGNRRIEAMTEEQFPAKDLGANGLDVSSMHLADFDRDGLTDILLTGKRNPAIVLFGTGNLDKAEPAFERRESTGFQLPEIDPKQVSIDDGSLLLAQGRYGRRLTWKKDGWQVDRQVNAPSSGARVDLLRTQGGGAAIVDNASDRLWMTADDGGLEDEVELGDLAVQDIAAADIDGDRRVDLLLLAGGRIGVLASRSDRRELQTVATYERESDEAYLADVVAGDFNNDGLTDLVINETGEKTLEIAAIAPDPIELLRADRFKLFEQKSFSSRNSGGGPREMIAADLTGDGLTDLVLLMKDRLLIFPQDGDAEEE